MTSTLKAEEKLQEAQPVPGLRRTAWDQQDVKPKYPKLQERVTADVVVIGAGIAGLSIAYNLVKEGKSVVVLEAKAIGAGQTGRTTAHLMPWNDDYYTILESMFGPEKTWLVGDSHRRSIDWIFETCEEEGIECKLKRSDGYLVATDESSSTLDKLKAMVDLKGDPKHGRFHSAIRWPNAGDFHPLMYINGLAEAVTRRGGRIYELSPYFSQEGTTVTTRDGRGIVDAGCVVMATNSPANHNLLVHARQKPDRSYVAGLKVKKGDIPANCEWWGTDAPYHYVRIEEKEDYDVLLVGGEDHPVGLAPKQYADNVKRLADWGRARWTKAGDLVYSWTGMVFKPIDFLGLYGKDPMNSTNTYIATGDSGEGMTGSTIAGILIKDLILGKANPWAEIYDPSRPPPPSMTALQMELQEVQHTVQGYLDNLPLKGAQLLPIEDLAPRSGAVVQEGLNKVAMYKDEEGKLTLVAASPPPSCARLLHSAAICPHLKCVVKWNPNDGTFDCPCHGSLFDNYGRLINGPAKSNLTPME
eukprot:jgi/Mesen1/4534/ME000231S03793